MVNIKGHSLTGEEGATKRKSLEETPEFKPQDLNVEQMSLPEFMEEFGKIE